MKKYVSIFAAGAMTMCGLHEIISGKYLIGMAIIGSAIGVLRYGVELPWS